MTLTKDTLIEEIKTDLGYPMVKVEIDDQVWDVIINKALRWFKAKKGHIVYELQTINQGQQEYDWPVNATAITDVVLPQYSDLSNILTLGLLDIVPADFVLGSTTRSSRMRVQYSEYVQILQSLEEMRKIFGADPGWYILDHPMRKVVLTQRTDTYSSTLNGVTLKMAVFYKKDDLFIEDFQGRDEDLVYRYCLARAKMILGHIRSKYPSYPTAGGTLAMDGDALKAEAKEELQLLDVEIDDSQGNAGGIVTG